MLYFRSTSIWIEVRERRTCVWWTQMRSIPSNTHTKHTVIIIAVFYSLREPNNSKNCELPFSNSEQLHFLSESPPLCSISIRWFWVESLEKLKTKRTQFIFFTKRNRTISRWKMRQNIEARGKKKTNLSSSLRSTHNKIQTHTADHTQLKIHRWTVL